MGQRDKYTVDIDKLPEEISIAIVQTIRRTHSIDKLIWWGRYHMGMTYIQIAERVNLSIEGVRQRIKCVDDEIKNTYETNTNRHNDYAVSVDVEDNNGFTR